MKKPLFTDGFAWTFRALFEDARTIAGAVIIGFVVLLTLNIAVEFFDLAVPMAELLFVPKEAQSFILFQTVAAFLAWLTMAVFALGFVSWALDMYKNGKADRRDFIRALRYIPQLIFFEIIFSLVVGAGMIPLLVVDRFFEQADELVHAFFSFGALAFAVFLIGGFIIRVASFFFLFIIDKKQGVIQAMKSSYHASASVTWQLVILAIFGYLVSMDVLSMTPALRDINPLLQYATVDSLFICVLPLFAGVLTYVYRNLTAAKSSS